ncbi:MAG: TIGR03960 family B12-binding radical SAM protein [Lachnospiraceae bacterium]|nr:TIGR03960 family B12-binding radical SAM protein [Lachnospiraceae bacterium]
MKRLALKEEQLLSLEKPERYLGNELNAVMKDPSKTDIRFAICFPDVYEIGMSHLGIQILYDMFNRREDVWCERVYSPWLDLDKMLREEGIPLFALESQEPVKDFDFLGITLQYEMCYTNVLQILDLSGIPLRASERKGKVPFVIGGGPCVFNPEPIADFFDLLYIGEGEVSYPRLFDEYKEWKKTGADRSEFLRTASRIPGIYVPSLYEVSYREDGTLKTFTPAHGAPEKVEKQVVKNLDEAPFPEKPLVPFIRVTQDRAVLEVMRGCIRGCRFCQAGQIYKPLRERSAETLKREAAFILDSTGQDEISLSSLSTSDHRSLKEILDFLIEEYASKYVNISLPSLRIDAFSLDVMGKVQDVKKGSLTFAPEAGSQRMRNVINKGLTKEDILSGAELAFKGGWNKVKLYFMLGLPTESDEDIRSIAELANEVAVRYFDTVPKEERKGIRVMVNSSASFFIPKPFTPFQWAAMDSAEEFLRKAHLLSDTFREETNHKSLKFQYHENDLSELEGLFARGDRRLSQLLECAYAKGCLYDSWSDYFHRPLWEEAIKECGVDVSFYTTRERKADELFPWDFIDAGVSKSFLRSEYEKAMRGEVTPNCRTSCAGCGAAKYGVGVCYENKA